MRYQQSGRKFYALIGFRPDLRNGSQPQPEMARTKIPSYRVKNGNGFFEPTPAMRAAGIKPIACGPDGPAAWSKAREQLERWSDIKSRATPRRGSFAPAERQADGGREQ